MSTDFEFPEPNPNSPFGGAIFRIESKRREFVEHDIDTLEFLKSIMDVWGNLNSNPTAHSKIESGIRDRRMKLSSVFTLDIPRHGDPIRKRYDPTLWMRNVPQELKQQPSVYILDRCKSLLTFLESLDSQK